MRVLGIETSCDETAAALVEDGKLLSSSVYSQVALHRSYAGVVPELASRAHCERIEPVIAEALRGAFGKKASLRFLRKHVDAVAYTRGPGLTGALLVGRTGALALSRAHGLPLIGVNHLEGHALSMDLVKKVMPPFLSLVVSGGHTELVLVRRIGRYRVLGRTRDDAAGEAFDKVAKLLKLGYPGGPVVDQRAERGNPAAVSFPRALLPGSWDFSFSGLKTAVLYHVRDAGYLGSGKVRPQDPVQKRLPQKFTADLCASFQEAVVDVLVEKTIAAARAFSVRRIVVGGGVAANRRLREKMEAASDAAGFSSFFPPLRFCGDNAAMIAYVGWLMASARKTSGPGAVDPSLPIRSWA